MSTGAKKVVISRRVKILLALAIIYLFLCTCIGLWIPGVEIAAYLPVAWILFLWRVVPLLNARWDLVGSTFVYLIALLIGSHLFMRWLYRALVTQTDASPARWRWRWTLSGIAIVLVLFAAGTAAVGIAHQTVWLARSPNPMYVSDALNQRDYVRCGPHLREIARAVRQYADANGGAYPPDFATLIRDRSNARLDPTYLICPATDATPAPGTTPDERAANVRVPEHCSYIYFGTGPAKLHDGRRMIAMDEPLNHNRGRKVGFAVLYDDGSVNWVDGTKAEQLLQYLGFVEERR